MEWSDTELDELASFFAKRMTVDLERLEPSDPPPPGDPVTRWRDRLHAARDRGNLSALARRIAAVDPTDANLQAACAVLDQPQGRNALQVLGAALSVGALLVFTAGGLLTTLAAQTAPEPLEPVAVTARAEARATPLPDPMAGRMVEGEGEVETARPLEITEAKPAPVQVNGRCGGSRGEVVGYWYAGEERPGQKGTTIEMDGAVNVRADYPDVHNGFEKRSAVKCVLQSGDRVTLEAEPIRVPGDAYWVPLVAGSIAEG